VVLVGNDFPLLKVYHNEEKKLTFSNI